MWWIIVGVGWVLWKTRNDLMMSNIIVKSPKQVAYKALGFLKQWTIIEGGHEQDGRDAAEDEGLSGW